MIFLKIQEVVETLAAKVLCSEDKLDMDVYSACGADLMSDVLAFVKDKSVLLTGLNNNHVVRTAEMIDVRCLVFVRGKMPSEEILEMAQEVGIVVLSTEKTLYEACGLLFVKGLAPTARS